MGNCNKKEEGFFVDAKKAYKTSMKTENIYKEQEIVDEFFRAEIRRAIIYKQTQCSIEIPSNKYAHIFVDKTLKELELLKYNIKKQYTDSYTTIYFIEWNFRDDECIICLEPVDEKDLFKPKKKSKVINQRSYETITPRNYPNSSLNHSLSSNSSLSFGVCPHKIHKECSKKYGGCPLCKLE